MEGNLKMTDTYVSSHAKDDASVLSIRGFVADRKARWIGGGKCIKFDGAIPPEKALTLIEACRAEVWDSIARNPETGALVQDASRRQLVVQRDGKPYVSYVSSDGFKVHDMRKHFERIEKVRQASPGVGWASVVTTNWGARVIAQLEQGEKNASPRHGVEFKSTFTSTIGHDGKTSTTHFGGGSIMSCDNQMAAIMRLAHSEGEHKVKVRHTRWSNAKLDGLDVQACLASIAASMGGIIDSFIDVPMSDSEFEGFVRIVVPDPVPLKGQDEPSQAAKTRCDNIRHAIWQMYRSDDRTGGYQRTAWGAFQAVNTYQQHERAARGQTNEARRWNEFATDKTNELETAAMLDRALNGALTRRLELVAA